MKNQNDNAALAAPPVQQAGAFPPASGTRPRRRLVLDLRLGSDNREAMANKLEDLAAEIRAGKINGDAVGGSSAYGYTLDLTEDPSITHKSYFATLEAFNSANTMTRNASK